MDVIKMHMTDPMKGKLSTWWHLGATEWQQQVGSSRAECDLHRMYENICKSYDFV